MPTATLLARRASLWYAFALVLLLSVTPFLSGCRATAQAQAEIDRIQAERTTALEDARAAGAELATAEARALELEELLEDLASVSTEDRAAWELEAAVLAERILGLSGQVELLDTTADTLDEEARLVKAADQGAQAGMWGKLLGVLAGGGALGKILSMFGTSRGAAALAAVQAELAALRLAATAFEASPSRSAGEVGELRVEIARLESYVEAFVEGLGAAELVIPAPAPEVVAGATLGTS